MAKSEIFVGRQEELKELLDTYSTREIGKAAISAPITNVGARQG